MQSEHLTNLHPGWVIGGWLVAVAVTSGLYLGGIGAGLMLPGSGALIWVVVSIFGGFFAGGLFVGVRWTNAPILHGGAITLVSVAAWFVVGLGEGGPDLGESMAIIPGMILVQFAGAAAGGWTGRRIALGGRPNE
jgi:hypothetical protein